MKKLAGIAAFVLIFALLLCGGAPVSFTQQTDSLSGLRQVRHSESLTFDHYYIRKMFDGKPVLDGSVRILVDKTSGQVVENFDEGIMPTVKGPGEAYFKGQLVNVQVVQTNHQKKAIFLRAVDGVEIGERQLTYSYEQTPVPQKWYKGRGRVIVPNPIVATNNILLRDGDDAEEAVPATAYRFVTLKYLDGSGYLSGKFVRTDFHCDGVYCPERFQNAERDFSAVTRQSDEAPRFEEGQVYFGVTEAARLIRKLGFSDVMDYQITAYPYDFPEANAYFITDYYYPGTGSIHFGYRFADAAEDLDIVWHEYGHAIIENQVPGGNQNFDGFGEGFSDFWSAAVSLSYDFPDKRELAAAPCLAEWFTENLPKFYGYDHCLRSLENQLHYPDDLTGEPHADGLIIGGALWDGLKNIGRRKMLTIALEANFTLSNFPTQTEVAKKYVAMARRLGFVTEANLLQQVFLSRGLVNGLEEKPSWAKPVRSMNQE